MAPLAGHGHAGAVRADSPSHLNGKHPERSALRFDEERIDILRAVEGHGL